MQMPRFVLDAGNSWRFLAAYSSNSASKPITLRDIPIWFVMNKGCHYCQCRAYLLDFNQCCFIQTWQIAHQCAMDGKCQKR